MQWGEGQTKNSLVRFPYEADASIGLRIDSMQAEPLRISNNGRFAVRGDVNEMCVDGFTIVNHKYGIVVRR